MAGAESAGRRGRRKAKEAAVGAAARALFYPTLLYNVVRSKVQAEFRWWDEVDQFILLGAVPFRRDVLRLQKLGVYGVVTLNEPFETLVPSSMYQVKHKNMTRTAAFEHVRSKRARVLLTRSQWKVVQEFSTKVLGAAAEASPSGDVVLLTEEGSGSPGIINEDASLSSHKTTTPY